MLRKCLTQLHHTWGHLLWERLHFREFLNFAAQMGLANILTNHVPISTVWGVPGPKYPCQGASEKNKERFLRATYRNHRRKYKVHIGPWSSFPANFCSSADAASLDSPRAPLLFTCWSKTWCVCICICEICTAKIFTPSGFNASIDYVLWSSCLNFLDASRKERNMLLDSISMYKKLIL